MIAWVTGTAAVVAAAAMVAMIAAALVAGFGER